MLSVVLTGELEKFGRFYLEKLMSTPETEKRENFNRIGKIITFTVDETLYAVESRFVRELICSVAITRVRSDHDLQYNPMINVRGKLVRMFNINKLLGRKRKNAVSNPSVLLIEQQSKKSSLAGLTIDSIGEVISDGGDQWYEGATVARTEEEALFSTEIKKNGQTILLLDVENFFKNIITE